VSFRRIPLIANNWKMYKGGGAGCELAHAVVDACGDLAAADVVLCPPFTALAAVAHEVSNSRIQVGAQNFYPKDEGAFTGERTDAARGGRL
jgi:triosephosphate isomerase